MASATTTSWADIQRLAADLQRVQMTETSKRLTDVNCVEVVSMLIARGLVDLVVSTDGKEYVTRKHLQTECANECLAAGGRIALTELAAQLNVDLDHVNTAVSQLLLQWQKFGGEGEEMDEEEEDAKTTAQFVVCAGELLHRTFINDLCSRLDGRLQEIGHLSMLQLTRQWELPTELLNQHVLPELGTGPGARICAIRFEDQLCTVQYIQSLRAKLRAMLIAVTKPMPVAKFHEHMAISQSLFFKLWNELAEQGKLPGKQLGPKNSLKSLYVPDIHERLAKQFVRQQLAEHNYIECSILKRLSLAVEPTAFFRELLGPDGAGDLLFWPSVVLSEQRVWRECDTLARNLLQANHFCLLEDILPQQFGNFLTQGDRAKVVERLQQQCNGANLRATDDSTVVYEHPHLLKSWLKAVDAFLRERAIADAPELRKAQLNAALAAKQQKQQKGQQKEQQQKETADESWELDNKTGGKKGKGGGGKKGGGGQASGKSSKQQQQKSGTGTSGTSDGQDSSSANPLSNAQLSALEILKELCRQLAEQQPTAFEVPEALWEELADDFCTEANKLYRQAVAETWQQQQMDSGELLEQRKAFEQRVAKCSDAYGAICLFERGTEAFDDSLATDLRAYLLRSLCSEMAQALLIALADPGQSTANTSPMSAKHRDQLICSLESAEMQKRVRAMFDSLAGTGSDGTLDKFHEAIHRLATLAGLMQMRQPDKKERAERLMALGAELEAQLASCEDAPTLLLLAVLLSLHRFHGLAVHASGKFVSQLIAFLCNTPIQQQSQQESDEFPPELASLLNDAQRLVVASIKRKGGGQQQQPQDAEEVDEQQKSQQQQLAEYVNKLKTYFAQQ